jgi:hypothetical protein
LNKLFYRRKKTRMQSRRVECPYHRHCSGNVAYEYFDFKDEVQPFIRCPTDFRSKKDLFASVYAEALSRYVVVNGKILERKEVCHRTFFNFYLGLYTNKSQILIRPIADHSNGYLMDPVIPSPLIKELVRRVSNEYIYKMTGLRDIRPGTLAERAFRVYSIYHLIYEKMSPFVDNEGQYVGQMFDRVVYTTANMSPQKQVSLLKEYDTDTCFTGQPWARVRKLFAPAYEMLLDYLNVREHFNTFEFKYSPENLFFFNWNTGGGIIPGQSGEVMLGTTKVKIHNSGKKAYLWESNLRAFHMFMIMTALQKEYPYFDLEVIRQKKEWKKLMGTPTMEKLMKLILSMREFFIPSMFHSFMGHTLMWFMKYILSGTYITVGLNFMNGGAYNIAKLLSYDVPGQRWGKGDVEKLDKNIQASILRTFIGTAYLCLKMDNKTQRAQDYIKTLFRFFLIIWLIR